VFGCDQGIVSDEVHLEGQDAEEEVPVGSAWGGFGHG
jgi:hypothetical protein